MIKQFIKEGIGWGVGMWVVGYILGIILFPLVSQSYIGWIIMPIGTLMTCWVALKKVKAPSFGQYLLVAIAWTLIAVVCDYFFLVKVFKPTNYYKLDVYVYYALTFAIPIWAGWKKSLRGRK